VSDGLILTCSRALDCCHFHVIGCCRQKRYPNVNLLFTPLLLQSAMERPRRKYPNLTLGMERPLPKLTSQKVMLRTERPPQAMAPATPRNPKLRRVRNSAIPFVGLDKTNAVCQIVRQKSRIWSHVPLTLSLTRIDPLARLRSARIPVIQMIQKPILHPIQAIGSTSSWIMASRTTA